MKGLVRSFGPWLTATFIGLTAFWLLVLILVPQAMMIEQSLWSRESRSDLSVRIDRAYNDLELQRYDLAAATDPAKRAHLTKEIAELEALIPELEAQEQSARARYEELTILYARAVLSSFRDVENALSASVLYQRQYQQARLALDQARVAFRLADTRYRTGTVDFLTVLDAQRTVFQASDQLVLANLARFNARVDLYRALGGGWDGVARA